MKKLLLIQIFLFIGLCGYAQVPSMPKAQSQQVKVENLTDEQIRRLVSEMKQNSVGMDQLDDYARQKGIPKSEVSKLKDRIRNLNLDEELMKSDLPAGNGQGQTDRKTDDNIALSAKDIGPMTEAERQRSKIFGFELFSNKNLTFEPNLRIATPPNYKLSTNDELIIDVYGYSEVQHKLKVSPEGYIRIPYLGPVYVNGLTVEEATNRITKELATIYGGIKSGNTFVQVSLGDIRSIRVLMIGQVVRPGSYTLSSLSTVANSLYISGGPDENGSLRDIQVIRNGQPIVTFDLYDFLRNGNLTNNIILQDQDIVKVNPYKTRIELAGEVKRPAVFDVKEGESLLDIIEMAGGYTDLAFKGIIRAHRINNKEREVVNISAAEVATFKPHSGDKYFVDAVLDRFANRVSISGAVFHPADYALEDKMTLIDLIRKADGVTEDALHGRAIIFRLSKDNSPSGISFNLNDILSGQKTIALQREDSVVIYSKLALHEEYQVKISGEVNNPGYYSYSDSLHIEDLILIAGGLRDAASFKRIEVARRIRGKDYSSTDSAIAIVAQFDINSDLRSTASFQLQPFDEIVIRKSPTYMEQITATIDGEVVYPGTYTINSKYERISDILLRAGGLRPEAYADGAVLLRKTFVTASDSALLDNKLTVFYNKLEDSSAISKLQAIVQQKEQVVGINLAQIIQSPGSKFDLYLEDGDKIKIPKKLQTVQLFGEIYFPKKVRFDKSIQFRDYVRGAGGFTNNALKRRSYIVYANGEVKSTKKMLFFNSYPKVRPGAEIYVPTKAEKRGLTSSEAIGIASGLATLGLVIVTLINGIN